MRSLPLVSALLAGLAILSACGAETALPRQPESPAAREEATATGDPRIASIAPARRDQILEKKAENSDAVGWLTVPGTDIDDVVLLNPPYDNDYYTTHNFLQQPDRDGAYGADYHFGFADGRTRETIPRNTPLYAHNHDDNPDGILFAQLKKYKDPEFAREHPYLFFSTAEEDMVWEVFAVYDATVDLPYIHPGVHWSSFETVLETILAASIYDYSVTLTESDRLLTLSTCTFSVDGHPSMPITVPNDYRFVVMARLASPDEPVKREARFTVQSDPLAPDDMPPLSYLWQDIFLLEGLPCGNGQFFFNGNDCIDPIDPDKLVPIGRIARSHLEDPAEDFEATQLPVGTVIYRDPDYPDVLVANVGRQKIPYIIPREERALDSVRYTLRNRDGVLKETHFLADQLDLEVQSERLERLIDTDYYTPLPDDIADIARPEDEEEICIAAKNALTTFYQFFFLGTPASLGQEVLIVRERDGYFYGDAALFGQLRQELDALSL